MPRILITGLASHWGGQLARELERDARVEALVGVDTVDPRHQLNRTEFVRVGPDGALLRRIIAAARIDTVIDTWLIADTVAAPRRGGGVRLDALRGVIAAAGAAGTPVRKLIVKSSARVYPAGRDDPAFFTEEMAAVRPARTGIERALATAEGLLEELVAAAAPVTVTILRVAEPIGGEVRSAQQALLGLPAVPSILGFDPRWQFVHERDVVGALRHAAMHELPGAYNVAADGVLALSEVVSLLGKTLLPVLPPWGTVLAALQLRRLHLPVPVELLRDLRGGRGLDNRRLKAAGYTYRFTSREAVIELRAQQRLRPLLEPGREPYRYERDVEEFLRWSPSVRTPLGSGAAPGGPAHRLGPPAEPSSPGQFAMAPPGYEDLSEDELLQMRELLQNGVQRREARSATGTIRSEEA